MKKTLQLLPLLTGLLVSPAFADEIKTKSEIDSVTVYTNRATVTRVATVTIPKGSHTVVLEGLPTSLIQDSLLAKGVADAAVKIGAIAHKSITTKDLTSEREKEMRQQIEKLNDQIDVLDDEIEALDAKLEFIDDIADQAKMRSKEEIATLSLKPQEWEEAASYIHKKTSEISEAQRNLILKQRPLKKEKSRIERQLNANKRKPHHSRRGYSSRSPSNSPFGHPAIPEIEPIKSYMQVKIPLEAEKETEMTLSVEYQVSNATWRPLYDARLNTQGDDVLALTQFGSVKQNTGEDWTGVALTLSTAQPHRGTSLAPLHTNWITARKPLPPREEYKRISGGSALPTPIGRPQGLIVTTDNARGGVRIDPLQEWRKTAEARRFEIDFQEEPEAPPQPSQYQVAQINTGGFVSEYKVTGRNDVLSDGTFTKLMIGDFKTEADLQVYIKPQLGAKAYLVADTKLKGESPILPGSVNLFRDNVYVGKTNIPLLRPDEDHVLYFGIDDQVSVKRKTQKDFRSEDGLIVKDNILQRSYLTEIKNLHNFPVEIVVRETVPTSKSEEAVVSIDKKRTTPGFKKDTDNKKGLLSWTFELPKKSNKNIQLDWSVTWPKDYRLSGI